MKNQVVSDVESKIYKIILVCIIASSVVARFYQYIFHKDLWLDEAMLTFSITNISLWDMLSKPLPSLQSAPLGFLSRRDCCMSSLGRVSMSCISYPLCARLARSL